jgi:hypothetical protein
MAPIAGCLQIEVARDGAIAQLGERVVRNDEVGGSIPPGSTNRPQSAWFLSKGYDLAAGEPLGRAR